MRDDYLEELEERLDDITQRLRRICDALGVPRPKEPKPELTLVGRDED